MDSNDELDKYLEKIYLRECVFSISQEEVNFIKNGIEDQVFQYLEQTYKGIPTPCMDKKCEVDDEKSAVELLKVGSFYEGTKNGFPDEFDFIAVLGNTDKMPDHEAMPCMRYDSFCSRCKPYTSEDFRGAEISFHFTAGTRKNGNAEKLEFYYKKDSHDRIIINADVVVALRCKSLENLQLEKTAFHPMFYQEVMNTGQALFIYTGASSSTEETLPSGEKVTKHNGPWDVSFTETEVRFVREILSDQHRKVYRIIKYLINGPFGEDLFKHFDETMAFRYYTLLPAKFCISSYAIKIAMFYHNYDCSNDDSIGKCAIQVLEHLLSTFCASGPGVVYMNPLFNDGPCIAGGDFQFLTSFYWCLKAFIFRLVSLKNGKVKKCDHDFEESLQEMALRLPIFQGFIDYRKKEAKKYSHRLFLLCKRPKQYDADVQKLERYLEKRKNIPYCPWCDFEELLSVHI